MRISRKEYNYITEISNEASNGRGARLTQLAKNLKVSPASAYEEVFHLVSKGLVRREGEYIYVTEEGNRELLYAKKAHRVIETFLVKTGMGVEDACRLTDKFDLQVPEEVVEHIYRFLGKPERCPHSHEIPDVKSEGGAK
ncbi:DtxR family iron (metal) dependent repressor [Sulfodiicoccus acidiphilus]|uniref:DtxR family iron (Metal) dependent repressor n=1 Tax=Sulfodiicoccus acidiphilus TaxID=1670455 RepID=A0A348B0K7_9CREN|nr:metal-dependent transcriptional regulator [Sulfodiicoccus acidiphilus]BBD71709.1 DtxR family iron (metal) dependent repressor [Sulfodiicoccus acidiphilus]GGT86445.1 DtxR family iron (metal) dependent repressor [Sulfodiicoccus acidiphilus]